MRAVASSRAYPKRYRGRRTVQHRSWSGCGSWARFVVGRKIGRAKCPIRMTCLYRRIGGDNLMHPYIATAYERELHGVRFRQREGSNR